jgi:hypothetical protein
MTVPETPGPRRFLRPCDYYASPTPETAFPKGVTYGCAAASALVLILVFVGGAFLSSGGFGEVLDLALGMSLGEMRGLYAGEVTPARKKSLDAEVAKMRQNLRDERVSAAALQPFLEELREAISDRRVTAAEAEQLEERARKINAAAKPPNAEK